MSRESFGLRYLWSSGKGWLPGARGLRRVRLQLAGVITLCVIASLLTLPTAASAASGPAVVSLTFDNGSKSQYDLAYPQLTSHGVHATFFVNSGTITTTQGSNFMTWSKLQELQAAGNDVGGKTVNASNLTTIASLRYTDCSARNTSTSPAP